MFMVVKKSNMERGSVVLEFVVMLPILLLLFGITLLTYDTILGKLNLQRANRLLAWGIGDRNVEGDSLLDLNKKIVTEAKYPFDMRNKIENKIDGMSGDMWGYGKKERLWAVNISRKQTESGIFIGETPWAGLAAGNMELEMKKVSGAYVGFIGLSSVMHSDNQEIKKGIAGSKFDLTHTIVPTDEGMIVYDFIPEEVVLRRFGSEHLYRDRDYMKSIWKIVSEEWPRLSQEEPEQVGGEDESEVQPYNRRLFDYAQ